MGQVFSITWDKEVTGGEVHTASMEINIGCKYKQFIWETLVHEISETIHILTHTHYTDSSVEGDFKFFMNHKQFDIHSAVLAQTLAKFYK